MTEKLLLIVGLVLCTGLVAAGCGGDDDGSTSTSTETTSEATAEEGSTEGSSASDQEKASFIEGCTEAAGAEASLSSEQADELARFCEEAFTSTDSLEEASALVCTKVAEVAGGLTGNEIDQARQACEADAQSATP